MAKSTSRYSLYNPTKRSFRLTPVEDLTSSEDWSNIVESLRDLPSRVAIIPAGMDGRPDLLSFKIYGTPDYWWLLCAANKIIDPFEQLTAGKQIIVPIMN
tara:strand:+ start:187 stop:486 length:300 start_codon:yes stop_codon:yes gene_type:complete